MRQLGHKAKIVRLLCIYVAVVFPLIGCMPGELGLVSREHIAWVDQLADVVHTVHGGAVLTPEDLREMVGEPTAIVPCVHFLTGDVERDRYRAWMFGMGRLDDDSVVVYMQSDSWRRSEMWIYDERAAGFLWPIRSSNLWRAYVFLVEDGEVVMANDTFPRWIRWDVGYWDDVRERMDRESGEERGP